MTTGFYIIFYQPIIILCSSFNFRGPYPFSENETIAVRDFVEGQDISISLSFHSFSEVIIYPWMHTSKPTPHEDLFISIGKNMSRINNYYLYTGRNYIILSFLLRWNYVGNTPPQIQMISSRHVIIMLV